MNGIEDLKKISNERLISEMLDIPEEEIHCSGITDILQSSVEICKEMSSSRRKKILAAEEFARRMLACPSYHKQKMKSISALADELVPKLQHETLEIMIAVALDTQRNILAIKEMAKASYNEFQVSIQDILREMLKYPVEGIVLIHSYPNTEPDPSEDDIEFTNETIYRAAFMEIHIIDSLVVGNGKYVSLRKKGCCIFEEIEEEFRKAHSRARQG